MARIAIDVPDDLRKKIKLIAASEDKTITGLLVPVLEHFVITHGKKQEK